MALKNFMAGRGETGADTNFDAPRAVAPSSPAVRTTAAATCIDAATQLQGKLHCKETLRIDGGLKGEVECDKMVIVGKAARIAASIVADEIQIAGEVKGDITARRKITLESTARVTGDLATPGIVIEEGAKLKGRIVIGSEDKPVEEKKTEAKPAPAPKATKVQAPPPA